MCNFLNNFNLVLLCLVLASGIAVAKDFSFLQLNVTNVQHFICEKCLSMLELFSNSQLRYRVPPFMVKRGDF
jgi:hypothetical protein